MPTGEHGERLGGCGGRGKPPQAARGHCPARPVLRADRQSRQGRITP